MLKKNKKNRVNRLIFFGVFMVLGLLAINVLNIPVSYGAVSNWGALADKCINPLADKTKAQFVGCKCNYMGIVGDPPEEHHIICADMADGTSSFLRCSDNDYNTSNGQVCLVQIGSSCVATNPDGIPEASCEAGSKCKAGKCARDTGGDTFEGGGLGTEVSDIRDTIRTIINILLGFLGVLCVIFIIYGGVLWLTSTGNPDKVKKGKDTMIWAALGAIIITIAWTITSYVLHIGEVVG